MTFFVRMAGNLPTMQKAFFRNAVAAVAAIAYAVFRHLERDYLDDFDADDFGDNFDDDFIEFSDTTPEAED